MERSLTPTLQDLANNNYSSAPSFTPAFSYSNTSKVVAKSALKSSPKSSPKLSPKSSPVLSGTSSRKELSTSKGKRKSSSSSMTHLRSFSSSSLPSMQKIPNRAANFTNATKLPLNLPKPPITFISNPHQDLSEHLHRHGLYNDAIAFESAKGMPVEFALQGWISQASRTGAYGLFNATTSFMEIYGDAIYQQLRDAQAHNIAIPSSIGITTQITELQSASFLPSHIMAIHSNKPVQERGILIPCHAMVYILQCVSLPSFASSSSIDVGQVPVVSVSVPRPREFLILHKFIYTNNCGDLLNDLLPMRLIARYCQEQEQEQPREFDAFWQTPLGPNAMQQLSDDDLAQQVISSLSYIPAQNIFQHAHRIHACWANGVAIGLMNTDYWTTLNRAWSLTVAALSMKKARLIEAEKQGLNLGLKQKMKDSI